MMALRLRTRSFIATQARQFHSASQPRRAPKEAADTVRFSQTKAAKLHINDVAVGQDLSDRGAKFIIGLGFLSIVAYCGALYRANEEERQRKLELKRLGIEEEVLSGEEAFARAMQDAGQKAAAREAARNQAS
ncbi:hypothetical protein SARC_03163 [Sphaeroforma arctica JP610]|uniref:Uncharacterized protein n=1 Tax=Sphaeroforma arctica JP610 TaxID=667725 RepID=A0A0L0G8T0_9EUKA|nr:hypothetical protein SARC_03163 [Sphaeroforma arctica JP610]KNC84633.1 hypothetical protein SARC_03163 [Sphaeroforma arctica JP610]|eukprot:XP_014158535.1 hypothetical protein SARC_03163 [Sphaeroforma arctica JP610]